MQNSQVFGGLRLIVVLLSWIFFSLGSLLLRLFLVFKLSSLKVWKCTDLGAKIFGLKEGRQEASLIFQAQKMVGFLRLWTSKLNLKIRGSPKLKLLGLKR